jgi:hypothetical protein
MAQQSVEFVFEHIDEMRRTNSTASGPAATYLSPLIHRRLGTTNESLALYKYAQLDTGLPIEPILAVLLEELRALSMCIDFPLTCNRIEYEIPPGQVNSGTVFIASRKSIGRGFAFEADERETASENLMNRFAAYLLLNDHDGSVAAQHYLTGLTLLNLEDQFPGLIDAAFMQFYQGCETLLLRQPRETVTQAKKRVAADSSIPNAREIQIIVAHVWKIRHGFFGHRALSVPSTADEVYQVAKQVLVARWLCRRLIDFRVRSANGLCREMRLYHRQRSEEFRGTIGELETTFMIPGAAGESVEIFNASGSVIETYVLK